MNEYLFRIIYDLLIINYLYSSQVENKTLINYTKNKKYNLLINYKVISIPINRK